jgi:hypothetical protein
VKKVIRTAPPASMIHVNLAGYCREIEYVKNDFAGILYRKPSSYACKARRR